MWRVVEKSRSSHSFKFNLTITLFNCLCWMLYTNLYIIDSQNSCPSSRPGSEVWTATTACRRPCARFVTARLIQMSTLSSRTSKPLIATSASKPTSRNSFSKMISMILGPENTSKTPSIAIGSVFSVLWLLSGQSWFNFIFKTFKAILDVSFIWILTRTRTVIVLLKEMQKPVNKEVMCLSSKCTKFVPPLPKCFHVKRR